jgi:hypothetical protein
MRIKTTAAALLLAACFTTSPAQAQAGNASLDMPREPLTAADLEACAPSCAPRASRSWRRR